MKKDSKSDRQKHRTRIWILVMIGVVLSLCVLSIWFLIKGKIWNVTEKEVIGGGSSTKPEVLSLVESEVVDKSKIRALLGVNHILFWYPAPDIQRLLAVRPAFQSIRIKASPIRRHVEIKVTEREVRGIWCGGAESRCYLFDKEGIVFENAPETSGSLILKVTDESNEMIIVGERAMKEQKQIEHILESVIQIEKDGSEVIRIRMKERALHEWELDTRDGVLMRFSTEFIPGNLEKIIREIQQKIQDENITELDFRIPNKIYYK